MWSKLVKTILFNRYTTFLLVLLAYLLLTDRLIEFTKGVWRMEVPFLLYAYYCLNTLTKESRWQPFIAALPLAGLYLFHDYYFFRFYRIPKLIEVTQLTELVGVADMGLLVLMAVVVLALVYGVAVWAKFSRRGVVVLMPMVLLCAFPFLQPKPFIQVFSWLSIEVIHYANVVNVEYNGRLMTALYNEAKRRDTMANIAQYRDLNQLSLLLPKEVASTTNGKNVHLIVMESFIDLAQLKKLPADIHPTHPDFAKLIGNKQRFSLSPVFGGYTAQAEFEFLCGVPALQEFNEIEFNVFTGSPTYCLPSILKNAGYLSVASNSFKPDFFNAMPAYQSIGFDDIYFPVEYTPTSKTYLSKGDEKDNKYFFDKELFEQNLAFVKTLQEKKQPFFNYLLTVYGHFPFALGNRVGPPVFSVPNVHSHVDLILNQHYYRTKALADYLNQLVVMDPEALIIVVSDHLPPMPMGEQDYDTLGYLPGVPDRLHRNFFLVLKNGQPEPTTITSHYNVYRLILDYVTNHEYCRVKKCDFSYPPNKEELRHDYRIIMGLASR